MKVGIIGGGAAGIMSALFACKGKNEVTVIEHNDKLLKKILSTGNGKCNFTNTRMEAANFHNNYRVIEFIDRFSRFDTIKFFNSIGVVEYRTISKNEILQMPKGKKLVSILQKVRLLK